MVTKRWKTSNTAVFNINYHIIWTTKYRLKVLTEKVEELMVDLIYSKADELEVTIKAMEIMPDHVHLFVSCPPNLAPQHIVQQFKGMLSRVLRKEFPQLKSRTPSLWTRSYYIESVGHISEDTIKQYVENQKRRGQ